MRIFLAIAVGVVGPLVFLLAIGPGLHQYHTAWSDIGAQNVFDACRLLGPQQLSSLGITSECDELLVYDGLKPFAWGMLAASIILPIFNWMLPHILGRHRVVLAHVFSALFPISLIVSIVIVIGGLALLSLAAHIVSTWTFQVIWYYLYIILAVGFLVIAGALLTSLGKVFSTRSTTEFGKLVTPESVPVIGGMINELSQVMNARPPKNIILGAAPTFYITNAPLEILPSREKTTGETVYISTTLAKILTSDELKSVIAHELMHYRGNDLTYTSKFYPIYKTLNNMISEVERSQHLFSLPLLANLWVLLDSFSLSERRISRERELEADRGAAEFTSPIALATALSKISTFSHLWTKALEDNSRALKKGDFLQDVTKAVYGYAVYECDEDFIDNQRLAILEKRISHPTDTHPTIQERYNALGVKPEQIPTFYFAKFGGDETLELSLTEEQQAGITTAFHLETASRYGVQVPAQGDKQAQNIRNMDDLVYQIAELFILADGDLDPEEVKSVEAHATKYWPGFNPLVFRERLHGQMEPNSIEKLAEAAGLMLTRPALEDVVALIDAVIEADGRIDANEKALRQTFTDIAFEKSAEADAAEARAKAHEQVET